ncbi:uncharacterized protein N0V89_010900 [Didymosphaeria variabile]|uniref:Uncharacterized protein n=1 Tax=Didymosphaeria variabile TaxID=1932322 RepID=A0A9W8XDT8_9PLEO|nr:uncharacterized protein N0V89_010900 [Didymosphaeria variabile]KAJ4346967.1 hypothetical protein N0V89_010900 [Didymosphaeria variabile]
MAELAVTLADASPVSPHQDTGKHVATPSDRDSGVFLSDNEDLPPSSRPSSTPFPRSFSANTSPQRTDSIARLRRPAELNLGANRNTDDTKPRSELDLRFDLIRNSKNQNKAALRSPTQLLKDRLNLSPKNAEIEEKVRIFTPPKPMLNGCILPGPKVQMKAFTGSSVRARIERSGRPAWWCNFDKLVIFDGIDKSDDWDLKFKTRTSKGLSIARRRGDTETVVIPMDCSHCQNMLNRTEWKYDIQVCKRSVCWDCKERCRWELMQEEEKTRLERVSEERIDANRTRADSVLQDDHVHEEELLAKIGIEQRIKTRIGTVGGIKERLDDAALLAGV